MRPIDDPIYDGMRNRVARFIRAADHLMFEPCEREGGPPSKGNTCVTGCAVRLPHNYRITPPSMMGMRGSPIGVGNKTVMRSR